MAKQKTSLAFLNDFNKQLEKMDGVSTSSAPPRYWYSTGNHVLNKIISGSFDRGIPQGRITTLAGPSGAGKSFILANLIRHAQQGGAYCLIIDSENALDDDFVTKIGVDVTQDYSYVGVTTISQVVSAVSHFLKEYKKEYGSALDAPPVFIGIDSLDMLMTDSELANYEKGDQKGDQGQKNKQLKAMLKTFVQDIKSLNVTMVCTAQVYKNQDVTNGEGLWIVSDAVKYSASQIVLVTKLKLKETGSSIVTGIRMKCEGYKTRFCKPFSVVTIEVPYETGMDPYSGLIETAVELNAIQKRGSRYSITGSDETWYAKDIADHAKEILAKCELLGADVRLNGIFDDVEVDAETQSPKAE